MGKNRLISLTCMFLPITRRIPTDSLYISMQAVFRTGDKSEDKAMLEWLCSPGLCDSGESTSLNSDKNPAANVYTMSMEIKRRVCPL